MPNYNRIRLIFGLKNYIEQIFSVAYLCSEQKLLLPSGLELVSESSESGALSLSSAARHIDFHSSRRIYVVRVAHSIALSLHLLLVQTKILECMQSTYTIMSPLFRYLFLKKAVYCILKVQLLDSFTQFI